MNKSLLEIQIELSDRLYKCYKSRYIMLITQIDMLRVSIENNSRWYIIRYAQRAIEESKVLDGYTECLYDIGFFSEDDFNKLWTFTNLVRLECMELL